MTLKEHFFPSMSGIPITLNFTFYSVFLCVWSGKSGISMADWSTIFTRSQKNTMFFLEWTLVLYSFRTRLSLFQIYVIQKKIALLLSR